LYGLSQKQWCEACVLYRLGRRREGNATVNRPLKQYERFFIYGGFGWCVEIVFTSIAAQIEGSGDITLQGHSYIWMPLVWGLGFLLMDKVSKYLQKKQVMFVFRGLVYMVACLFWEYIFGVVFGFILNKIPWDYSYSPWSLGGATRIDYAPFWYVGGLVMEIFLKALDRIRIESTR